MEFNSQNFKEFRKDVEEALAAVAEKHGLSVKCGNIVYGEIDFKMPIVCCRNDVDAPRIKFLECCKEFGFTPEDYGRPMLVNGESFTLSGLNRKAKINCCSITRVEDGKGFKCSLEVVKKSFKAYEDSLNDRGEVKTEIDYLLD